MSWGRSFEFNRNPEQVFKPGRFSLRRPHFQLAFAQAGRNESHDTIREQAPDISYQLLMRAVEPIRDLQYR